MDSTFPTLTTERLTLRPFLMDDCPDVVRMVSAKEIASTTLNIPHPYEMEMAEEWISNHEKIFRDGEGVNFAIELISTGELVGSISLAIEPSHHRAEMGYWIGKPYWGNGYCTEAACALLEFGFERLNLERIYAAHFRRNPASGRVMQKAGMTREGVLRHHVLKWDEYEDIVYYGILSSEAAKDKPTT